MTTSMRMGGEQRVDVAYIDGVRGILAILVVLGHTALYTGMTGDLQASMPVLFHLLVAGEVRVPAFIAISGFTLMLAIGRRDGLGLGSSFRGYAERRIRRLVPPYLAALMISLALIAFVPVLAAPAGTQWDAKIPVTLQAVVAHLFLFHNLSPDWISRINGPLWSLPVELQLSLLMPVLLVLWRRVGPVVVLAVLSVVATAMIVTGIGVWSAPHFLVVFGLGMYGAFLISGSDDVLEERRPWFARVLLRHHRSTLVLSLLILLGAFAAEALPTGLVAPVIGVTVGVGTTLLLAVLADGHRTGFRGTTRARRVLSGRRIVEFGLVSYSVYLLHSPLLALGNLLILPLGLPTPLHLAVMVTLVVPLTVVVCIGFAIVVERRFMNIRSNCARW